MANIAVVTIATGRYTEFIPNLYESVKKHFLKQHHVDFFCLTNHEDFKYGDIGCLYTSHEKWPNPTLKRYHKILEYSDYFCIYDYIYYLDADMLVVGDVGDEILGDIAVTIHP